MRALRVPTVQSIALSCGGMTGMYTKGSQTFPTLLVEDLDHPRSTFGLLHGLLGIQHGRICRPVLVETRFGNWTDRPELHLCGLTSTSKQELLGSAFLRSFPHISDHHFESIACKPTGA